MRRPGTAFAMPLVLALALATTGLEAGAADRGGEEMATFALESDAFGPGEAIPRAHTCEGADRSPPLRWGDVPAGTRSFVLLVTDPDAPHGTFTHWVLFDIPAGTAQLAAGASAGVPGRNDFRRLGWGGPCPPPGHGPHRYVFTLAALDRASLGLAEGATRGEVERAMEGHVLGRAELVGRYERR